MKRSNHKRPNNSATQISVTPPKPVPNTVAVQVTVPLVWTLLLSTALALSTALVTTLVKVAASKTWPWWVPIVAGISTWTAVFAWRVSVCESDRRALLLYPLEVALGQDLDDDGYVGAPTPTLSIPDDEPRLIHVYNAYQVQQQRNADDFRYFLKQTYDGTGATWRSWNNQKLPSGRQMTQPLWEQWTARLLTAGLGTRTHPTAPITLDSDYRQALSTLRELL